MQAKVERLLEIKKTHPDNITAQVFDLTYYESLSGELQERFLKCLNSGIENPDSHMGCYANQPDDYDVFEPFFRKALESYHNVDLSKTKHENNWTVDSELDLDLAHLGLPALSMRVRVGRNLKKFPLPGAMSKDEREGLEKEMGKVFDTLIADPDFGGRYVSITPGHPNFVDQDEYNQLVKDHIMFKDMANDSYLTAAGIASHWPSGRGCYISADKEVIVWVGEEDHLRIMCMKKGTKLNQVFDRLKVAIDTTEKLIEGGCSQSDWCGVVTSCPTNIGTGMRASVHIQLPNLTKGGTDEKVKSIAKPLGLSVRGLGGEHTPIGEDGTVDISPSARFCISEGGIITALFKGLELLKKEEEKLA